MTLPFDVDQGADSWRYTPLTVKPRRRELTIFMEWGEDEKPKLTTNMLSEDGLVNNVVGKFHVDKLPFGYVDRVQRFLGGDSTLYVQNLDVSKTSVI